MHTGNETREVRHEDAFDVEAVADWLRSHADDAQGLTAVPGVRQFPGGASNLTYLLHYPDRDLVLRRAPMGTKAKGAHNMRREYDIQRALKPVFPQVAQMVAFCDDLGVLGADFYVMDHLDGIILRSDIPDELGMDANSVHTLCRNALDTLITLHGVDVEAAGLGQLGRGPGYVRRQVDGWATRYRKAVTPDVGSFAEVIGWLQEHQPDDVGQVMIHNDFRFDNLVLDADDPTRILGVLDWELATVGDPLMDLGSSLAYWVQDDDDEVFQQFRRQPTNAPGMLTRDEVVDYYCAASGIVIPDAGWRFYEVFGLFRLAVIAQQIYYRYFHQQTTNPAYAPFQFVVTHLEQRCHRITG